MITYPRWLERMPSKEPVIRLLGIGNAGVSISDRIASRTTLPLETIAINSDRESLCASVASVKIVLGPMTTHGLGAGGDPETGIEAIRESVGDLKSAVDGADVVFLCAGLGGGTGGPATAILAEMAKLNGALVIAVVTSPFEFEGRRRCQQAREALQQISRHADAVVHFENDRMAEIAEAPTAAGDAFAACDDLLHQAIASLTRILQSGGPVKVAVADVLTILRNGGSYFLFGSGEATGANRAQKALEQALRSPLLEPSQMAKETGKILVHIRGPQSTGISEISAVMQEISSHTNPEALLHLGVDCSGEDSEPLIVTLIGHCGSQRAFVAERPTPDTVQTPKAIPKQEPPAEFFPDMPSSEAKSKSSSPKVTQETLPLEPITRGRFDKSEPTIVEGEDLDIPTFLRLKIKK